MIKNIVFCLLVLNFVSFSIEPCKSQIYLNLKHKAIDSLSGDELESLLGFQENCIDYLGDHDYFISPCDDSVYIAMSKLPIDKLSKNQITFLQQLEEDCQECLEDINRDKEWKKKKPSVILGISAGIVGAAVIFVVVPIILVVRFFESD